MINAIALSTIAVAATVSVVTAILLAAAAAMGAVVGYVLPQHGPAKAAFVLTTDETPLGPSGERRFRTSGERRFRRLVEHAWDAFILVDADGVVAFASDSIRRLLGQNVDDVIGQSIYDVLFDDEAPEGRESLREALFGARSQASHEIRATHMDGSIRWMEVTGTNFVDDPSVRAVVVNLRDVTARKEAEEALERSEEDYLGLVEDAIYGVYRSDPAGRFLAVNRALVRMLGYSSEEELLSVDVTTDVYADPMQRRVLIEQYRNAERIKGLEVEWKRRDGSKVLVWLSGRTIHDDRGVLVGFEMIAEDVTERRTLEAQLRQAQKMEAIGQLAGGIAHDFNNLLTVILANADIIEVTVGETDNPVKEELDDLRRSALHGRDLVKKLLGYGRRDMLEVRPVNLTELVNDTMMTLRRVLPASIDVRFSTGITDAVIEADGGAIQQILFNLATNARDAMEGGGTIRIDLGGVRSQSHPALNRWHARGEFVRLAMSDTGQGMDEDTQARVFDPFFTTKPPGVGTGLGMAMIYGLVKQQSGFIDIQSEVGKGTTVELFFPVAAAMAELSGRASPPTSIEGTETILVVEDESAIRRSVKRLLEKKGFRVLLAEDGQEGLEVIERSEDRIDLVVSDVVMPRMGGFELFEAVRALGNDVRFLFMSGYATPDIKRLARKASQTFLPKPWDVEDFLRQVRDLLDSSAAERETADT